MENQKPNNTRFNTMNDVLGVEDSDLATLKAIAEMREGVRATLRETLLKK